MDTKLSESHIGILYYLSEVDQNVSEEMYEPVSFETWKMLRELEPTKFTVPYNSYVLMKKEQFEREVESRKKSTIELKSLHYTTHPSSIGDTQKAIRKVIDSPLFVKWFNDRDIELVERIMKM
jgi:hypothetical protein